MSQMVLHEIGVRKQTGVSQVIVIREAIQHLGAWHLEAETGFVSRLYYLTAGSCTSYLTPVYVRFLSCEAGILVPPHGASMRIKWEDPCKVCMYLLHFKSTIKMRGGDAEMSRFAFSICSGSYASTDGNRQKGIGYKGQVGAEHSRLEVFGQHWHQSDRCSL